MGCSIRDACVEAKVSRGTVQERLKDTPEFYDQIEGFMSHIERLAQKVVYTKIKQGDDYNARRLLERRRRKTYATRTDHTTNDEAINLQFGV